MNTLLEKLLNHPGASGNVYTKQDVINTLLERYNDPEYQDIWETKDFESTKIDENNYLLTYVLIQNKTKVTRRSTIWRKCNASGKYCIIKGQLLKTIKIILCMMIQGSDQEKNSKVTYRVSCNILLEYPHELVPELYDRILVVPIINHGRLAKGFMKGNTVTLHQLNTTNK